jgi:ribosomal protein S18 acetylase RimI-like enzyme
MFMKTPASFTLRPATINDAPLFYSTIDLTMREFILATWGRWDEARVQQEAIDDSTSPHAQVIQIDQMAVGVWQVEQHATHLQLIQIYLLPAYQRLGIGTELINSLITTAQQSQLPIRLRVMAVNPAKKFYEKFGFRDIETTPEFFTMEKMP